MLKSGSLLRLGKETFDISIKTSAEPPSSPIQTILSAPESHRILPPKQLAGLEHDAHHRR
ncbi:hypothetical protein UZ38_09320 [Bacillus sp. CN2]|nr:hypothetical protein UZ38_09320 [Bacillus sp. CN2]